MRAGSALVRLGGRLLAIQDDAWQAWWIAPRTRRLEPLLLKGSGRHRTKKKKPDFEAAFRGVDGAVWVLGSGSLPNRCSIARIDAVGRISIRHAGALYRTVASALGMPPNIEGAVPVGDRLRLFHRGPGRAPAANAMLDLSLDVLEGAEPEVLSVRVCDLGGIGGLSLGFTDAVALRPDRVLYLAVAEDTPDGIADGPIAGSAVGLIEGSAARWTPLLENDGSASRRKIEGVTLDADRRGGWLLTDPDDPGLAAELCRVVLSDR